MAIDSNGKLPNPVKAYCPKWEPDKNRPIGDICSDKRYNFECQNFVPEGNQTGCLYCKNNPENGSKQVMPAKRSMYLPLVAGGENQKRMEKLLSITRFNENTKKALIAIYCNGYDVEMAAYTFDIICKNLKRSILTLDELNKTIHEIGNMN